MQQLTVEGNSTRLAFAFGVSRTSLLDQKQALAVRPELRQRAGDLNRGKKERQWPPLSRRVTLKASDIDKADVFH
jgi:hypothetical protein